ncbi:hypothetical protein NSK_007019 [Nannochloropsis salina CCMP1776]|uniref:RRM domain-containing protein n=1 Tax=Nannochloropsis salina CCMP1776 TaxID=1027361 RepID=A0A4D9CRB0_9STRA|nr:hypothetical protein NSK_007019 [Nannochloropsis salina CCMP1776]|eukprot:TFJ81771.1 hypothetical protein NSK_007019 [Nannochloropsis salina CCMP1776]
MSESKNEAVSAAEAEAPAAPPEPEEPAEDPNEVVRFLTHLSPTYAEAAKALVAAGVETVADLAGLEYRDLGSYSLPQDIRDKLGRVLDKLRVNGTVFISGLNPATTEAEIAEYFGQIGIVKKMKQKRGCESWEAGKGAL